MDKMKGIPENTMTVYTDEEEVFLKAVLEYKRINRRKFPSYTEILMVVKSLGYTKTGEAGPVPRTYSRGIDD